MRWPVGPRLPRRPGHRRPAPERRLVPRGRGALRRLPRGQRAARRRPVAAEPRHGHRRVGVGDRRRRGARPATAPRSRARPGCARASRSRSSSAPGRPARSSSSPRRPPRPIRRCCTSWTRSASSSGGWSSASAARAELERSNADLEAFAYVASHDLAEPLRSVAGFVALLERQYGDRLDDRAREFIAYAVDGVERMQRMIDDLLLYARAGTTDLRLERVDAGELVAGALRDLGTAVAERGAVVEVGALPVVRGDAGPAAAGVPQPAGQRDQVHRAGRRAAGDRSAGARPMAAPRSRSPTTGSASTPRRSSAPSRCSPASPAARRSTRAPGSGWPSRGGSSSATAGGCGSSPTPAVAACSALRLPLP